MKIAVTAAVLLAVVATAVVTVCQHSETRHLQYRVWQLERRGERLGRDRQRLRAAVEAARTPRRLLGQYDTAGHYDTAGQYDTAGRGAPQRGPSARQQPLWPGSARARAPEARLYPRGFKPGNNFEGGD